MFLKRFIFSILILFIFSTFINADKSYSAAPKNMVKVPGGEYNFHVEYRWVEGLTLDSLLIDEKGTRYQYTEKVNFPAFYIDKTEVTNEQFKTFMDATNYQPKIPEKFLYHWKNGTYPKKKAKHPVVWVSIKDAKAYAKWAGKRLPTESEWQKAAQSTDGRDWPWGNIFDPNKANMDSDDTRPVGSYPAGASPYGCLDMAGNVWEWTSSLYIPYPYDPDDGRGDLEAEGKRVVRGGSSDEGRLMARCAWRNGIQPELNLANVGFRIACEADS